VHSDPAAVFDERRGAFVEERNLMQAHAWMHD